MQSEENEHRILIMQDTHKTMYFFNHTTDTIIPQAYKRIEKVDDRTCICQIEEYGDRFLRDATMMKISSA
jgi:hypothetical protein